VEEFVKLNQEIHGGSFGGSDRDAVFEKNTSGKGLNGKSNGTKHTSSDENDRGNPLPIPVPVFSCRERERERERQTRK
jgi:hypothetical protein